MKVLVPISVGELIDKITILEIKQRYLEDPIKIQHVQKELARLQEISRDLGIDDSVQHLKDQLSEINLELWSVEEAKRLCERDQDFGNHFVELARLVYLTNDRRAVLKQQINEIFGSDIVEVKSHPGL